MKNYNVQVFYVSPDRTADPIPLGTPQPLTAVDHDEGIVKARALAAKDGKHVCSANHSPGNRILVYVTDQEAVSQANPPAGTTPVWRKPAGPKRL